MTTQPSWSPHPTHVAKQSEEKTDRDWNFWADKPLSAASAMLANVLPAVPEAQRQLVIRETLNTIEAWLRAEPTP